MSAIAEGSGESQGLIPPRQSKRNPEADRLLYRVATQAAILMVKVLRDQVEM
jgi:hypothetical protein